MCVADADHVVTAQVHVHPGVARPPEPEDGHLGVHDAHVGRPVEPLVVQQRHQPPEPLDAARAVQLVRRPVQLAAGAAAAVGHRGRRAPGQQAKVRVAHVAAETVHRRPDHVQAAAGPPAFYQRRQLAPHGHFRVVYGRGLTVFRVLTPHGLGQLKRVAKRAFGKIHGRIKEKKAGRIMHHRVITDAEWV